MERLNSITFAIFPAVFKRYYYYTSKCVCGVGYHIAQYALFHRKLWPNYMVLLCILCYKPNGRIFYDILLCIFNVRMLAMYKYIDVHAMPTKIWRKKSEFFFERFQMNLFIKLAQAPTVEDIFGYHYIMADYTVRTPLVQLVRKKNNINIWV